MMITMFLFLINTALATVNFWDPASDTPILNTYFSNSFIKTELTLLEKNYPQLVKVSSLGVTPKNNTIVEVTITKDVNKWEHADRPNIKYVSNMHGNEVRGRALLMKLAYFLVKRYDADQHVKRLVDSSVFHLIPTLNPDGYDYAERGDCYGTKGRYTSEGFDLNRDFPDHWRPGKKLQSASETKLIKAYAAKSPAILSISFHDGSLVANYPWDASLSQFSGKYSSAPDDKLFVYLAKTYSYNHLDMFDRNRQCPGDNFPDGITNGNQWYQVFNGMQDWNYHYNDCFELTLELGCCKFPQDDVATNNDTWRDNFRSIMEFSQQAHIGIRGRVTDYLGNPLLGAEIKVQGINKTIRVRHKAGYYWRLLIPGKYNITAEKRGYYSLTRKNVVVKQGPATLVNFPLIPEYQNPPKPKKTNIDKEVEQELATDRPSTKHAPKSTTKPAPKSTTKPTPKSTTKPTPKSSTKATPKSTTKPTPKPYQPPNKSGCQRVNDQHAVIILVVILLLPYF